MVLAKQAAPLAPSRWSGRSGIAAPPIRQFTTQLVDNDDGIVLDHDVRYGNPPDAPQLAPAIARVISRNGRAPRTVTADRSYGEAGVEQALTDLAWRGS